MTDTGMWGINERGLCSQMFLPPGSPLTNGVILSKRVHPSGPWFSYLYNQNKNTWQRCCKAVLISVLYSMLIFVQIMGILQLWEPQVKPLTVPIL